MSNGRRTLTTTLIALTAAGSLLAPLAPEAARARNLYSRNNWTIAPGVVLSRITESGPLQVRLLTIDPRKAVTIDVGLARGAWPGWARTSQIAKAHNALAAVNGDFGGPGYPLHPFLEDGALQTMGLKNGASFAISADEARSYIGQVRPKAAAYVIGSGRTFDISGWNSGSPGSHQISGFTPTGGSAQHPPRDACSARLAPITGYTWTAGKSGLARTFNVKAVACARKPMSTSGGIVLSARSSGTRAATIRALRTGTRVRLTWAYGWSGIMDSIGGTPQLLRNGRIVAPRNCGYFCSRNPRTGVGFTAKGKILVMTIDGRQSGWSVGVTPERFAKEFKKFGAVNAINLDGGGSTTMVVNDEIVNRPSDAGERYVSSALLVLPGKDKGEPVPTDSVSKAPLSPTEPETLGPSSPEVSSASLAYSDPASTGGMLAAMSAGRLGGTTELPPELDRIARDFRAAT